MASSSYEKRRRQLNRRIRLFFLALCSIPVIVFAVRHRGTQDAGQEEVLQEETQTEAAQQAEPEPEISQEQEDTVLAASDILLAENDIYTFLQGPKAWAAKEDWSGSWNAEILAGQYFSAFGCGLCDLANVYSTLTDCDCSPIDMFYYAKEVSGYAPVSGFGAIAWEYMRQTLAATGITGELRKKDADYADFQREIARGITAIVLVCSANDSTYWQNVSGHYVNIWLYDEEEDTVFLADSGNPAHNRQRVPLRYIYDALKTSDEYQYLLVTEVDTSANTWGHDGIDTEWNQPTYF